MSTRMLASVLCLSTLSIAACSNEMATEHAPTSSDEAAYSSRDHVHRNGYTLDVRENGCTIEVVRVGSSEYVRVQGWTGPVNPSEGGLLTKRRGVVGEEPAIAGSLPLRDGAFHGHTTNGFGDGACYARRWTPGANDDCFAREATGVIEKSGSSIVEVVYHAAFFDQFGTIKQCEMVVRPGS
jgi:hypothetical protein